MSSLSSISSFDVVIITAPTAKIASTYQTQLNSLKSLLPCLRYCTDVRCVPDPPRKRVGSGGGTLNALDIAHAFHGSEMLLASKTLIIHSGGDSRRAPFHSVCGKAWTTLNAQVGSSSVISTPLALLLEELSSLACRFPVGSLTVASCDVLLDLKPKTQDELLSINVPTDSITIIAVPEDPLTAKNHGVLCSPPLTTKLEKDSQIVSTTLAEHYLQKPSLAVMDSVGAIYERNGSQYAWIDTGIVIIGGSALHALLSILEDDIIKKCTLAHSLTHPNDTDELRLELYSDILLALRIGPEISPPISLDAFLHRIGVADIDDAVNSQSCYHHALMVLFNHLHTVPLYMLMVPTGLFCHLGTSKELLELVTSCSRASGDAPSHAKFRVLADKYILTRDICNLTLVDPLMFISLPALAIPLGPVLGVKVNSVSAPSANSRLCRSCMSYGCVCNAFLEHSFLVGSTVIGDGCVVSHVKPNVGENLFLLDNNMIQQVDVSPHSTSFVVLTLGTHDDVKAHFLNDKARVCGVSWSDFFAKTGMFVEDVWSAAIPYNERSLWTASLFAILDEVKAIDGVGLYSVMATTPAGEVLHAKYMVAWLQFLEDSDPIGSFHLPDNWLTESLLVWRSCRRLSLSDLLQVASASAMHNWRAFVTISVNHLKPLDKSQKLLYLRNVRPIFSSSATASSPSPPSSSSSSGTLILRCCSKIFTILTEACRLLDEILHESFDTLIPSFMEAKASLVGGLLLTFFFSALSIPSLAGMHHCFRNSHERSLEYKICKIITSVFINCGARLPSALVTQRVFNVFYIALDALNGADTVINSAEGAVHSLSLFLSSLVEMTDIKAVSLSLLAAPILLGVVEIEFHPRFVLFYSWLVNAYQLKRGREMSTSVLPSYVLSDVDKLANAIAERRNRERLREVGVVAIAAVLAELDEEYRKVLKPVIRLKAINEDPVDSKFSPLVAWLESLSQKIVSSHIQFSLQEKLMDQINVIDVSTLATLREVVIIARSPARVDIAGGWSDTPPCSYEVAGAVLNVAVLVDGRHPIHSLARFTTRPSILLKSIRERRSLSCEGFEYDIFEKYELTNLNDFDDAVDPSAHCGLLKAALIALGIRDMISAKIRAGNSFSNAMASLFSGGLEIVGVSGLPAGSGMGGSSILAAAVLSAVSALLGLQCSSHSLIYLVSQVEQIMTTGGGWQDQIGSIYGGFKIGRSQSGLPMTVSCEEIPVCKKFKAFFERRTCLLYTGTQRLAKDTLVSALRKCSMTLVRTSDSKNTLLSVVDNLSLEANEASRQLKAIPEDADDETIETAIDSLSETLNEYWALKKQMAAGSEPEYIRQLLVHLRPLCSAISLCGAGAGGFAVLILKRSEKLESLDILLEKASSTLPGLNMMELSRHAVTVDLNGLTIEHVSTRRQEVDEENVITDYLSAIIPKSLA